MPIGQPVTASAVKIKFGRDAKRKISEATWEDRAWDSYDRLPELHYGIGIRSHIAEKFDYFAARRATPVAEPDRLGETDDNEAVSASDQAVIDALEAEGGPDLIRRLVTDLIVHFDVVGRAFLVAFETDEGRVWKVLSTQELRRNTEGDGRLRRVDIDGTLLPDDDPIDDENVYVVWRPHPRNSRQSDSPLRASLEVAEQLILLNREMRARSFSRLPAGMLLLPDSMDLGDDEDENTPTESFERELTDRMMAPITDQGSAGSVAPWVITAGADDIDKIKHLTFDRDWEVSKDDREELIRRLANGMDLPPEILLGVADLNHWCSDDTTEILTRDRGWVTHDSLNIGDLVMTIDHDRGVSEWQPVLDVYRADVSDEPMLSLEAQNHSSLSTANHRWPVYEAKKQRRDWCTSEKLRQDSRIYTAVPHADLPTVPKVDDALVELIAWLWTEGNLQPLGAVSIAQSHTRNPERVDRIRAALTSLLGPARESLRTLTGPGWREKIQLNESSFGGPITVFYLNLSASRILIEHAPGKRPSFEFLRGLTLAQLELFIDVSAQGDGQHYRRGRLDMWQKKEADLAAYEYALILSGRMTRLAESHDDGYRLGVWSQSWVAPVKAAAHPGGAAQQDWILYTGLIWCPVTRNGTWFARRDGKTFYTGNSLWGVQETTITQHVDPSVRDILDSLTVGWFRPLLEAAQVPSAGVVLWRDYTPAVVPADQSTQHFQALRAGLIGFDATRERLGYDEEEAPSIDELELIGWLTGRGDPAAVDLPGDERGPVQSPRPGQEEEEAASVRNGERVVVPRLLQALPEPRVVSLDPLAALDAGAFDYVLTQAEAALDRALEKAGARMRSEVQRSPALREAARGVANQQLGVALRETFQTSDVVTAADFDAVITRIKKRLARTQAETRVFLDDLFDTPTQPLTETQPEEEEDLTAGVFTLRNILLTSALAALFTPGGEPDPADVGELRDLRLPAGEIRDAISVVGGGTASYEEGATWELIGNGRRTNTRLLEQGATTLMFQWQYGDPAARTRNFEPHRALNGTRFTTWDDPLLAQTGAGSWVSGSHFRPGDHRGCLCRYTREVTLQVTAVAAAALARI